MAYTPTKSFSICAYASGSAALQNMEVSGPPEYAAPMFTWVKYSKPIPLGDGTVRGAGWSTLILHWDVITNTQRDWLRAFCPNQSAEVYIRSMQLDNSMAYVTYRAVMVWPIQSETQDAHRRTSFDLKFQRMIPV